MRLPLSLVVGVVLAIGLGGCAMVANLDPLNIDVAGIEPLPGEGLELRLAVTIPVTISAFNMVRQVLGFVDADNPNEVRYRVRGKLEGELFGTRRFNDEGSFDLPAAARPTTAPSDRAAPPPRAR